ncbi:MAG: hypothetical protein QGH46_10640 [Gammaproteobacteria bacterium]|jgi:hypothetical protein|nr:hypothetical protein [Gammaproteobacteria bacterium]MDP7270665.1 hypothetical protein [Gammaproteobacteria bacterium]HJP03691.1 hypothetical protein [Gammaproteobacteria bacterium]
MMKQPGADNGPSDGLGVLRISGNDRQDFLQGQLTQDVDKLTAENPLFAGWTSAKGRLRCLLWVVDWRDAVWLILPKSLLEPVARQLAMFVLRADVQIGIPEVEVNALNKAGLQSLDSLKVPSDKSGVSHCIYSDKLLFLGIEQLQQTGLLLTDSSTAAPSVGVLSWQDWRRACVRAGLPSVWLQSGEMFVPQMLNLDLLDAISFSKGCYVGQEIIARTQNLGRIKRRMYGFRTKGQHLPGPGDALYSSGKKAGELVDAVCGEGSTELLAVVPIDKLDEPLCLDSESTVPLERVTLPYPVPEQLD